MPVGALVWPEPLLPQQVAVPLLRSPQEWYAPAVRVVKVPAGTVAWP